MFDGKAFGEGIVEVVKAHLDRTFAPLSARLDALEKQLSELPVPKDGKDSDEDAIVARVSEKMGAELSTLAGDIGNLRSIVAENDLPDIVAIVADQVGRALPTIPVPVPEEKIVSMIADSVASGLAGIRSAVEAIPAAPEMPDIAGMIAEAVQAIEEQRGQDAAQVKGWMDEVEQRFAALPTPAAGDGVSDIDIELIEEGRTAAFRFTVGDLVHAFEVPLPVGPAGADGKDGAPGDKGGAGRDGKDGRDGLDVKDLFRADGGRLVAVMSDGTTKDLGVFVGKDGERGGDGLDGVGFDDMTCDVRGDGVYLVWEKGDLVKEARLPVPMDMGVYKADASYLLGHCVTWGGSVWIAQKDGPAGKPDAPDSDWRLAVKHGRAGKDAK